MRRRLLVSLATFVLLLALVEGAVRVRQYAKFGTTGPSYHQLEEHAASGLMVPKAGSSTGPIDVNADGFRSPLIPKQKPAGTVRLAFLGGSTTFCAEVSSNESTWPHLVVEALRSAHPEVRFDYLNAGGAGYTTSESLLNLQHRVAPYEPDVIVVYHGTNDLVHVSRDIAIERGLFDPETDAESRGWLSRHWMTWYLLKKNLRFRSRTSKDAEGAAGMPVEAGRIGSVFAENLERLLDEAAANASLVCLPTFATKLRADQDPEVQLAAASSALYYMDFFDVDQIIASYAEINATIRAAARAHPEILLIEGEDKIPADDEHFSDTVHFLDAGAEAQAARLTQALLASDAFLELLSQG